MSSYAPTVAEFQARRGRPAQPVKERANVIGCGECGAEFPITNEKFLRRMRSEGWRLRTTGEGEAQETINVCAECSTEDDW